MATKLTKRVESEIQRLVKEYDYGESVLKDFALFVLEKPIAPIKPLTLPQLKQKIYQYFEVKDATALKKAGGFKMATSSMGKLDLSKKAGWEQLHRKFIGILPGEENEQGYGCINGINIFKYDLPWKAFGLDPETSTTEDVKAAYRSLSKIYHPDGSNGDVQIFERLNVFYRSLTEKF
ncbi:MAG: molecular chaperone DnaJ [Leptolyngbyaceae cyanobacterium SM1_3_5]|nr:molecular chaperone DnaJ [Leptolyngbyaceae cyanobacterium SM1_3_5]